MPSCKTRKKKNQKNFGYFDIKYSYFDEDYKHKEIKLSLVKKEGDPTDYEYLRRRYLAFPFEYVVFLVKNQIEIAWISPSGLLESLNTKNPFEVGCYDYILDFETNALFLFSSNDTKTLEVIFEKGKDLFPPLSAGEICLNTKSQIQVVKEEFNLSNEKNFSWKNY